MTEQRDHLDHELDAALAAYSARCERVGLETRILARLDERPKCSSRIWYAGAAALACLLLFCVVFVRRPQVKVADHRESAVVSPNKAVRAAQPAAAVVSTVRHSRRRRHGEVKLAQFPTPTPLTDEERALLRLSGSPASVPKDLTALGAPIEPIQIAAIEIKPLEQREEK